MTADRRLRSQQQKVLSALRERLVERSEVVVSVAERERLDREIDSLALAARDLDIPWASITLALYMSEAEAIKTYEKQQVPRSTHGLSESRS
jgi:hypothetical protein